MGAPTNRQPDDPTPIGRPDDRRRRGDVGTGGLALEERMSASEPLPEPISEITREIASEVVRLHTSGEKAKAKELARTSLPWNYDYESSLAFYTQFMKKRPEIISAIGAAFTPDDLASVAMMEAETYLHGSWGHAVAVSEGTNVAELWQHKAFLKSASLYGHRCIADLLREELKERRQANQDRPPIPDVNAERPPRDFQFVVHTFSHLAKHDDDGGDLDIGYEDRSLLQQEQSIWRELQRLDAEQEIAILAEELDVNDRIVLTELVKWHKDHDNLHGFYEVLIAAFAANGQNVRPDAARQRVRAARQRIFGSTIARHRAELRAALASIAEPMSGPDPLTITSRVAVTYLIEEAGKASWRTTFDHIRAHLKNLELDTAAPWNRADTASDALDTAFSKVASAYRYRHGRSFWATRD